MPTTVARCLIALALAVGGTTLSPASPAAAHGPKVWWVYAYPFGAPVEDSLAWATMRGSKQRLELGVGASSAYVVRSLKWKNWGHQRAVAQGRVRYCDDTCTPWSRAKIVLKNPQWIDCYHGSEADKQDRHQVYRVSRVWGFDYLSDGFRSSAPRGSVRC